MYELYNLVKNESVLLGFFTSIALMIQHARVFHENRLNKILLIFYRHIFNCISLCVMVKQVTLSIIKKTLENTEGAIKNGQSRETGNIVYTRGRGKPTQYVLDTTTCKQTQIRHEPSYTQQEIKTNRTSFYGEIVKYHVDFIKYFKCQTMILIVLVHHK